MSAAELEAAYLIIGGDRPKIARALQRLRARVGDESVELLSARETSGDEAVAACNALGLFGAAAGRLVVVEEVERWKAPDVTAIAAYLAEPAPDTVVALVGDLKADSALGKAVAKRGKVLTYDVTKRALPAWVGEQFARAGAEADPEACRALVDLVGHEVEALATEIDKLATWAGGERITIRDVEALVATRAEPAIFELTDAWGRRDLTAALAACESLLERSERSRRDELARIAGALAAHVARVRACQGLSAACVRARDAAAQLKMHPFAAEKAFAQAANFSVEELRAAVVRLAKLDHAIKGGSRLAVDLELERALVDITRSPVAAGAVG